MREPRNIEGALSPLFDRLSGKESVGREDASLRILDRRALRKSVLDDVLRLLNSRSTPERETPPGAGGTVLDYGIPDFSWATPTSELDGQRLAEMIARKVAAYEPRLTDVRAAVTNVGVPKGMTVSLTACLRVGSVYEPVTFPLTVARQHIKAEPV